MLNIYIYANKTVNYQYVLFVIKKKFYNKANFNMKWH